MASIQLCQEIADRAPVFGKYAEEVRREGHATDETGSALVDNLQPLIVAALRIYFHDCEAEDVFAGLRGIFADL